MSLPEFTPEQGGKAEGPPVRGMWGRWHWEPRFVSAVANAACVLDGRTDCHCKAKTLSSTWLRFRAGPVAAKISLQPGLCAQAEATFPKQLPVMLFWPWWRPRHIQTGHNTVQLILNHPMPQFSLLSGDYNNPKSLWSARGTEWGMAKPCSHGPCFSSITSMGLFLISVSLGHDHTTGEPRGTKRPPLADNGGCSYSYCLGGARCYLSLNMHVGPKSASPSQADFQLWRWLQLISHEPALNPSSPQVSLLPCGAWSGFVSGKEQSSAAERTVHVPWGAERL